MTAEGLNMSQQKLQKRISDLKEEVAREQSLRASLEESHNTLLTRVREMESVVEMERSGVRFGHWSVQRSNKEFYTFRQSKVHC